MKIISKFHDYYDTALQYGQDESLLYLRKETFVQPAPDGNVNEFFGPFGFPKPNVVDTQTLQYGLTTNGFTVLFCGRYYHGLKMQYRDTYGQEVTQFHYTVESAMAFLERFKIPETYQLRGQLIQGGVTKKTLEDYFKKENKDINPDRNIKMECPIILSARLGVYRDSYLAKEVPANTWNHVVKNPCLRNLEFFRVMDANMAYQELSMFLGGVMTRKETPIVVVKEETRIKKRGFDKFSLRKLPTKKKKKNNK